MNSSSDSNSSQPDMTLGDFLREVQHLRSPHGQNLSERLHTYCWNLGRSSPAMARRLYEEINADPNRAAELSGMSALQCAYIATRLLTTTGFDEKILSPI